jgi:predicted enzyme involved in methoxymalonyl-ACP biosynthesis
MDENGNVIPTNGKPGRPKKQKEEPSAQAQDESSLQQEMQQMKESYERRLQAQAEKIAELESRVRTMEREEKVTIDALEKILTRKTAFLSMQQKA